MPNQFGFWTSPITLARRLMQQQVKKIALDEAERHIRPALGPLPFNLRVPQLTPPRNIAESFAPRQASAREQQALAFEGVRDPAELEATAGRPRRRAGTRAVLGVAKAEQRAPGLLAILEPLLADARITADEFIDRTNIGPAVGPLSPRTQANRTGLQQRTGKHGAAMSVLDRLGYLWTRDGQLMRVYEHPVYKRAVARGESQENAINFAYEWETGGATPRGFLPLGPLSAYGEPGLLESQINPAVAQSAGDVVRRLPGGELVASSVERSIAGLTSPLGVGGVAGLARTLGPSGALQAVASGEAGAVGAGTIARAANAPPLIEYGAEALGGVTGAAAPFQAGRSVAGIAASRAGRAARGGSRPSLVEPDLAFAPTARGAPLETAAVRRGVDVLPQPPVRRDIPTFEPVETRGRAGTARITLTKSTQQIGPPSHGRLNFVVDAFDAADGRPLGRAEWRMDASGEPPQFTYVNVPDKYHGRGIGGQLADEVLDDMEQRAGTRQPRYDTTTPEGRALADSVQRREAARTQVGEPGFTPRQPRVRGRFSQFEEPPEFPEPLQELPGAGGRLPGMEPLPGRAPAYDFEPVQGALEVDSPPIRPSERDPVAEALARIESPPTPSVGRPQTPEEQLALLRESGELDFPLRSWREIVAEGDADEFHNNYVTRMDDIVNALPDWFPTFGLGRTAKQAEIRKVMVEAETVRTQGGKTAESAVLSWIGHAMAPLRLTRDGYARGVRVRPGVVGVDREVLQSPSDIIENLHRYDPTPEQLAALELRSRMVDQGTQIFIENGGELPEWVENYSGHIVIDKQRPKPTGRQSFPGQGRPGFAKERILDTREDAIRLKRTNPKRYFVPNPTDEFALRMDAAAEAQATLRIKQAVADLGVKPTELYRTEREARAAAAAEYRDARRAAIKSGSVADREVAVEAKAELERARGVARKARARVADQPTVGGRVLTDDQLNEFLRYNRGAIGLTSDLLQAWRSGRVGLDAGSMFLQNFSTFFTNPAKWAEAGRIGFQGAMSDPYAWVIKNKELIKEAIQLNVISPHNEFLYRGGGPVSQFFGRLPLVHQANRFFDWNITAGQILQWEGIRTSALRPDGTLDLVKARPLASVVRHRTGSAFTPGLTKTQAAVLPWLAFAPRFLYGLHRTLVDPLITAGARRQAAEGLVKMFGGATLITYGAHWAINGEAPNMTDPWSPGFWGVRIGDGYQYPLGPFHPMVVAAAKASVPNPKTGKRDPLALVRYLEGKSSLPAQVAVRVLEAMGVPLTRLRGQGPFESPELVEPGEGVSDVVSDVARELEPIGIAQAREALFPHGPGRPDLQRAIGLSELVGGRTSMVSPVQKRDEMAGQRFGDHENYVGLGREPKYADLTSAHKLEVDAALGPEVARDIESFGFGPKSAAFKAAREAEAAYATSITTLAAQYRAGELDGEEFRNEVDNAGMRSRVERDIVSAQLEAAGVKPGKPPKPGAAQVVRNKYAYSQIFDRYPNADDNVADRQAMFDEIEEFFVSIGTKQAQALEGDLYVELKQRVPEFAALREAKARHREVSRLSPITGWSRDEYDEVRDLDRAADQLRDEAGRAGRRLSDEQARREVARQQGVSSATANRLARWQATKWRQRRTNRPYIDLLVKYVDILAPFYPQLYDDIATQEAVSGAELNEPTNRFKFQNGGGGGLRRTPYNPALDPYLEDAY